MNSKNATDTPRHTYAVSPFQAEGVNTLQNIHGLLMLTVLSIIALLLISRSAGRLQAWSREMPREP